MKGLKSTFSVKEVFVMPIVLVIVVCFIISIVIFSSFQMTNDGLPLYKTPIWSVFLFALMLFYNIRYFLKTFKEYVFINEGFEVRNIFRKDKYSWHEVKQVSLVENNFEKILFYYLIGDSLVVELKNGQELVIFSKYYSNMPKIRRLLYKINEDLISNKKINFLNYNNEVSFHKKQQVSSLNYKSFKGVAIFTFYGWMIGFILFFILFMLFQIKPSNNSIGILFIVLFPIFFIRHLVSQMHFFELNKSTIRIRNHILFWRNKTYQLSNINQIYLETPYRKSDSLRIITHDYETNSYCGTSLRNKHWKALREDLRKNDIEVIDELFYE